MKPVGRKFEFLNAIATCVSQLVLDTCSKFEEKQARKQFYIELQIHFPVRDSEFYHIDSNHTTD
jgi:hypothetical protein